MMPSGESKLLVRAGLPDNGSTDSDCPPGKRRRMGSETADSTPISKLGDDLLAEILIRLPNPRFACRCTPVCKRWNTMISSLCFNRRFVAHHKSRTEALGEPPLILPSDDPLPPILSFLPVPDEIRSKFVIWDSFKDLVLCGFQNSSGESGRFFLICNSFTKQWVALPLAPESPFTDYRPMEVRLVCEEAGNPKNLDLGDGRQFVYSEYRFRVLLTHEPGEEQHVFCSTSRTWSKMPRRFPRDAVSLNGKLYWWDCTATVALYDPFSSLEVEYRLPPLTDEFRLSDLFCRVSVSQGALYVIQPVDEDDDFLYPDAFRVWRWEEDSETWTMCYELARQTVVKDSIDIPEVAELIFVFVLAQHPEKSEIFFVKCCRDKIQEEALVYSYNFRTRKLELFVNRIRYNVLDRWMVFQPKATCFFTPIPSYNELLGGYAVI